MNRFTFLGEMDNIEDDVYENALFIYTDVSVSNMIAEVPYYKAKKVICIDHHKNENPIGQLCINDDAAAATAVIVYRIMRMGGLTMDARKADLLALAILTDTGNFKFARNGDALRIMADLVDAGVNIRSLIELMNNKPRKAVQLEARTADKSSLSPLETSDRQKRLYEHAN